MTRRTVGRPVTAMVVRLVIGADRIVRTNGCPVQRTHRIGRSASQSRRDRRACPARRPSPYRSGCRSARVRRRAPGQRIYPFLEGAGRISAIQRDLGHQRVCQAMEKDVGRAGIVWRVSANFFRHCTIALVQHFMTRLRGGCASHCAIDDLVKVNEDAFSELLDRR